MHGAGAAYPGLIQRDASAALAGGVRLYWSLVVGVLVLCVGMAVLYAPIDPGMGLVQKVIYLHIPSAAAAMVAAGACCVASGCYLWTRGRVWDAVAGEAARAAVFCGVVVLATGMVWGKSYWGAWWAWSPRLTFTLILCCLYGVMLVLRGVLRPFARRSMVCAVYGVLAFLDAPLVYLSVRLLPDVHPTSVPLTPEMRYTLWAWFLLAAMAVAGVVATPLVRHAQRRAEQRAMGAHVGRAV